MEPGATVCVPVFATDTPWSCTEWAPDVCHDSVVDCPAVMAPGYALKAAVGGLDDWARTMPLNVEMERARNSAAARAGIHPALGCTR